MNRYAIIENSIVTNIAVASVPLNENWIEITDPAIQIGWIYENEAFQAPAILGRNRVVITGLSVNGPISLRNRVILQKGQSLGVSVQFQDAEEGIIPITDLFAVPIYQLGGVVAQSVAANFTNGSAEMLVNFPDSGEFVFTEEGLNLHLPEASKVEFTPFYISVLQV